MRAVGIPVSVGVSKSDGRKYAWVTYWEDKDHFLSLCTREPQHHLDDLKHWIPASGAWKYLQHGVCERYDPLPLCEEERIIAWRV